MLRRGKPRWFLRAVEFSPDGETIVTGGGLIAENKELRGVGAIGDVGTGTEIYSFAQPLPAWGLAVNGDGSRIVSVSEDSTIRVFNAFDGSTLGFSLSRATQAKS